MAETRQSRKLFTSLVKNSESLPLYFKELKTGKRDIELMDGYIHESLPSVKTWRRVWAIVRRALEETSSKSGIRILRDSV